MNVSTFNNVTKIITILNEGTDTGFGLKNYLYNKC